MCGIVLVLEKRSGRVDPDALARALEAIHHRGPDERTILHFENAALGFNRLSIVDVAGGHQPLLNEDESIALVCNGEIYNYRELREELIAKGHRFRTSSDCEVILHLYEEDPDGFVARLDGMFGFVLLDKFRRRILVGRDRAGIKPLFIHDGPERIVVASELKAILKSGLVPIGLDGQSIYDFFVFSYVPGRHTAFQGVDNVSPATLLRIGLDDGRVDEREYWQPVFARAAGNKFHGTGPFAAKLRATLMGAVAEETIGDLPIGAYLSGGIDSTVISISLKAALNRAEKLRTFSIKFADPGFDESPIFRQTIAACGFDAAVLESPPADAALFQKVLYHLEQPQSSLLDVPMFSLSALVREHGLKVILAGEGSDELFGGYFQFTLNQIRRALLLLAPGGTRDFMLDRVLRYYFRDERDRVRLQRVLSQDPAPVAARFGTYPAWYPSWLLKAEEREGLFHDDYADSLGEGSAMHGISLAIAERYAGIDDFNKSIYLEMRSRLPNYILARADRNSMAHSVEVRVPFLSNRMIDEACAMPPMVKMLALREKHVLRQAFAKLVPKHVSKRMKFGYNAPSLPLWQGKDALRDDMISGDALRRTGLFRPETVDAWRVEADATDDLRRKHDLYGRLTGVLSVQLLDATYRA